LGRLRFAHPTLFHIYFRANKNADEIHIELTVKSSRPVAQAGGFDYDRGTGWFGADVFGSAVCDHCGDRHDSLGISVVEDARVAEAHTRLSGSGKGKGGIGEQ
jgi:hypothetical protein